jgi:hypothetical protein
VRQRCKFGCIICGTPFFDYDHMVEWAVCREHDPGNINLLCPQHHAAKTRGLLSLEALQRAAARPMNTTRERTTAHSIELTGATKFDIGSNLYLNDFTDHGAFGGVMIDGCEHFGARMEEGWLMLNLRLTNVWGKTLLEVVNGEMSVTTGIWDFNRIGQSIELRYGRGHVAASLDIGSDGIKVRNALFGQEGKFVLVQPHAIIGNPDIFAPPMAAVQVGLKNRYISGSRYIGTRYGVRI